MCANEIADESERDPEWKSGWPSSTRESESVAAPEVSEVSEVSSRLVQSSSTSRCSSAATPALCAAASDSIGRASSLAGAFSRVSVIEPPNPRANPASTGSSCEPEPARSLRSEVSEVGASARVILHALPSNIAAHWHSPPSAHTPWCEHRSHDSRTPLVAAVDRSTVRVSPVRNSSRSSRTLEVTASRSRSSRSSRAPTEASSPSAEEEMEFLSSSSSSVERAPCLFACVPASAR